MKDYYLMNKDRMVAEFHSKESRFSSDVSFEITKTYDKMPFGVNDDITAWISDRKAAKHRVHLKEIMEELGCYDNEGFINITHIASINDTFWAKPADSSLTWKDVSLYQNEFTEAVSSLVFEGMKRHHQDFSSTSPDHSPELVIDGSYPKCFRKEGYTGQCGSDIFIYKRGHKDTSFEPYCEMLASEIAGVISPDNTISYELVSLHGKRTSKCNLFTNEHIGYAPYCDFADKNGASIEKIFEFFRKIGSEQAFTEMLLIDALCFNEDRHAGNYGVLFDTDTLEVLKMSPVFDLNLSLLVDADDKAVDDIGYYFYSDVHRPKLGEDFTAMGQFALENDTSGLLKKRVEQLKDFSFSFRGDRIFTAERVAKVEQAVRKQAEAILSNERLQTRDVFPSEKLNAELKQKKKIQEARKKITDNRNDFMDFLDEKKFDFGDTFGSAGNDAEYIVENMDFSMTLNFEKGSVAIQDFGGKQYSLDELQTKDKGFCLVCKGVIEKLKEFSEYFGDRTFSAFLEENQPKRTDYED